MVGYMLVRQIPHPYIFHPLLPYLLNGKKCRQCKIVIIDSSGKKIKGINVRLDRYNELVSKMKHIANKYNGNQYKIRVPSNEREICKVFDEFGVNEEGAKKIIEMFSGFTKVW